MFEIIIESVKELHNTSFTRILDHPDWYNKLHSLSVLIIRGVPHEVLVGKVYKYDLIWFANRDESNWKKNEYNYSNHDKQNW